MPINAVHEEADWRTRRRCGPEDAGIFFPKRGGSSRPAKLICADCPVRAECLRDCLESINGEYGIWGGTSPRDRRALKKLPWRNLSDEELLAMTALRIRVVQPVARKPRIRTATAYLSDGRKVCRSCGEAKDPVEDFHRHRNYSDGRDAECRACSAKADKRRRGTQSPSAAARLREERRAQDSSVTARLRAERKAS